MNALLNIAHRTMVTAQELPPEERAGVYRDLAKIIGDEECARDLNMVAEHLERADAICRALIYSFSEKIKVQNSSKPVESTPIRKQHR